MRVTMIVDPVAVLVVMVMMIVRLGAGRANRSHKTGSKNQGYGGSPERSELHRDDSFLSNKTGRVVGIRGLSNSWKLVCIHVYKRTLIATDCNRGRVTASFFPSVKYAGR